MAATRSEYASAMSVKGFVRSALLLLGLATLGSCAQCVPGPGCPASATNALNAAINSNTNTTDKEAACRAASYFESASFGPGCTVVWK